MATYIDFASDEEQGQELARFIVKAKAKGGEQDETLFNELTKSLSTDASEFWIRLLKESPIIFSEVLDKDVESFFMVVCSSLKKAGVQMVQKVTPTLLTTLTTPAEEKPLLRLRILNNTYNILDTSPNERYLIFHAIMNFTVGLKHSEVMLPHFKDIEKRIKEWGIEETQVAQLYKDIRNILRVNKKHVEAFQWNVKYLGALSGSVASSEIEEGVIDALSTTELYQFDELLALPAVQQLEKTNATLLKLLNIFVSQKLDALKAFVAQNGNFLKQVGKSCKVVQLMKGLDEEECTRKMRILTLASLGAANHVITYASVSEALQVELNQVELWVVSAISEGVLEARMDQLRSEIVITRALQRVFTINEWKKLGNQLNAWSNNVKILLNSLQNAQAQHQATLASSI